MAAWCQKYQVYNKKLGENEEKNMCAFNCFVTLSQVAFSSNANVEIVESGLTQMSAKEPYG